MTTRIYTSCYGGPQKGLSFSISLYPPKGWKGGHLGFLAPSKKLFDLKLSPEHYDQVFQSEMALKSDQIRGWLNSVEGQTLTLNCYEAPGQFCHRNIVADIIRQKRPDWIVGEISQMLRKMKALTLHQPYAWLVGRHKSIETRSATVRTNHRGKIAIHAAARDNKEQAITIEAAYQSISDLLLPARESLVYGSVVAIATLKDCVRMNHQLIEKVKQHSGNEFRCGLWEPGRQAWFLEDIQILDRPVPARGAQGLWDWWYEDSEIEETIPVSSMPETKQLAIALPEPSEPPVIQKLGTISDAELEGLKVWLQHIKPFMFDSISSYAPGRKELHLRNFVKLKKASSSGGDEIKAIHPHFAEKYQSQLIESIGDRLLPGFHQGLVLFYPKGSQIKTHRDSPAYATGAASVNIVGSAKFLISNNQKTDNLQLFNLKEGDCIRFDNKQPHAILPVEEDRWCVCFFYLKDLIEKSVKQLSLIALEQGERSLASGEKPTEFSLVQITSGRSPLGTTPTSENLARKMREVKERGINLISHYEILENYQNGVQCYTWKDNHYGWWSVYGESAWKIEDGKAFLNCMSYGIPLEKLIAIDPVEVAEKNNHHTIFNGEIIPMKDLLLQKVISKPDLLIAA